MNNQGIFYTLVFVLTFILADEAFAAECVCDVVENLKGPIAQASIVTIILLLIVFPIVCKLQKIKDTKKILISFVVSTIAVVLLNTSLFFTEIIIDSMFGDKTECCDSTSEKGKIIHLIMQSMQ